MFSFLSKKTVLPPTQEAAKNKAAQSIERFDPQAEKKINSVEPSAGQYDDEIISTIVFGPTSSQGIHVETEDDNPDALLDEVAILFASSDTHQALTMLEDAIQSGSSYAPTWDMLFNLYQLLGMRQKFDALAILYKQAFKQIPPAWVDLSSDSPRLKKEIIPTQVKGHTVFLPSLLDEDHAPNACSTIEEIAVQHGTVQIDAGVVESMTTRGALNILKTLHALSSRKTDTTLIHSDSLIKLFHASATEVSPDQKQAWLNFLDLLQYCSSIEVFEEQALNFAMTFEESPPSWESRAFKLSASQTVAPPQEDISNALSAEDFFSLEGELTAQNHQLLNKLTEFSQSRTTIHLECAKLRRVDFAFASSFMGLVSAHKAKGKHFILHNTNAMIVALFRTMGVGLLVNYA